MANSTTNATGGTGPLRPVIEWINFANIVLPGGGSTTFTNTIPNIGILTMDISSISSPLPLVDWTPVGAFQAFAQGYSGMTSPSLFATNSVGFAGLATLTFNNFKLTDLNGNAINQNRFSFVLGVNDNIQPGGTITTSRYQLWQTNGGGWNEIGEFTNPPGGSPKSFTTGYGQSEIGNYPFIPTQGTAFMSQVASTKSPTNVVAGIHATGSGLSASIAVGLIIDAILPTKQVSLTQAGVGSILTYTIPVFNNSDMTLSNLVLLDTLPTGVAFNPNSFQINGVTQTYPEFSSITLPDIAAGSMQTLSFKVTVVSLPSPNTAINNATVTGQWATIPGSGFTNQVVTTINNANLTATKSVNLSVAQGGQQLTYTILLSNSGNVTATTVVLNDTLPATTTYVAASVTGATGTPPNFSVGNIGPNKTATVTFKVLLNTVPNNTILNDSTAKYNYFINGGTTGTSLPGGAISNQVSTTTGSATISSILKTVDKGFGTVGDTLTYQLVFRNTGNISATNVTFIDTIPNNTSFVTDSLFINNAQQTGLNPNPPGVTLGSVGPLNTVTISFKVSVATIPTVNPVRNQGVLSYTSDFTTTPSLVISNIVPTTIVKATLSSSKVVNKNFANIGDILTYTIPISNSGNTTISNILFLDTIPLGTTFISNSLKQDGVVISGSSDSPGVTLPNAIGSGKTTTVTFQVQVTTIPNPNPIPNTASIIGSFTIDSTTTPNTIGTSSSNTNIVNTQINNASLSGVTKFVDKSFANCGDTITYTIQIPNTGNVTAQNVIFKDTIPNGTILVNDSVFINGVLQTNAFPSSGVTIPNIAPGETTTLTFTVLVQC